MLYFHSHQPRVITALLILAKADQDFMQKVPKGGQIDIVSPIKTILINTKLQIAAFFFFFFFFSYLFSDFNFNSIQLFLFGPYIFTIVNVK